MAELIQKTDTLNEGREKLNEAIKDAEKAKEDSSEAIDTANTALSKSDSTQTQLDNIVIEGDSSVEAAQARVDEKGQSHTTLKERIDDGFTKVNTQLAETDNLLGIKGSKVEPIKNGAVTFITDDGNREDFDVFKDIFASAGVPCCTAILTRRVELNDHPETYCTKEELLELQNEYGWEVMSHTYSHPRLTELTDEQIEDELRVSKEYLDDNGFITDGLAYPHGDYDERVKSIAKKYYKAVRSSDFGSKGYNDMPLDTYALKSCWFDTKVGSPHYEGFNIRTFEYYKNLIDQATEGKKWLIISFHSFDYQNWSVELRDIFTQIVNYAASNSNVMRFSEAYEKFANSVDVGYGLYDKMNENRFAIGRDGSVKTNYKVDDKEFNGKSSYVEFDNMTTTISVVNQPDADMPTSDRGIMITHRYGNVEPKLFTTQFYYSTQNGSELVWKRNLARDGTWYDWKRVNNYVIGIRARNQYGFNPSTPIEDFPIGVTENAVASNSDGISNAPVNTAGVLITHRFDETEKGYNFQEYYPYGSDEVYKRTFQTDGQPKKWVKIGPNQFSLLSHDATNPDTPITEFELGVTRNIVQGHDGTPNGQSGTLTTNKNHKTEHVFNWQEFEGIDRKRYKRRFNSNGSPENWRLVWEP